MKKSHNTILIVDDDPHDRAFIESSFRAIGVSDPIHTVNGGQEAIAYMLGEGKYADRRTYAYPTFITIDLKMSGKDGFAVLEHLKNNPEWAIIPTVVLTASRLNIELMESYKLGVNSYVIKPADARKFQEAVATLAHYWLAVNEPALPAGG